MPVNHQIEDMGDIPGSDKHLYRGHDSSGVFYNTHGGSGGYRSLSTLLRLNNLPNSCVSHFRHCLDGATLSDLGPI